MTFAIGRRFLIVDGVERWTDADVKARAHARAGRDAARDDGRLLRRGGGPRAGAQGAARRGHGRRRRHRRRARAEGQGPPALGDGAGASASALRLDGSAARALVAQVGDRQQRLLRELEKLALEHGPGAVIGVAEVEASVVSSAERQVWGLVDAVVARDRRAALAGLRGAARAGRGRRAARPADRAAPARGRRDRRAARGGRGARRREGGPADGPFAADRRIREARGADAAALQAAVAAVAQLELATRGGERARHRDRGDAHAARDHLAENDEKPAGSGGLGPAGSMRRAQASTPAPARTRAARDFLRAPVLRCSAPRLTALSIVETRRRCSSSATALSPPATAAPRRRK